MKKLVKLFSLVIASFVAFLLLNNSVKAWFTSILIVYYQYEDKTTAAPTVRQYPSYGEAFSILSPEIEGFNPDIPVVEGVFSDSIAYWVTYYPENIKEEYLLKINYVDDAGNILFDSFENKYESNYNYEIESPLKTGYTPDKLVVSGTLTENTEIDVIYKKNKYELQIDYLDEFGESIYDSYVDTLYYEEEYNILSPTIYGHTPNHESINGIITENIKYEVTYYRNSYELIINYIDEKGKSLYPSYTENLKYNDEYNVEVPNINGYTPNCEFVSGNILDNTTIDVIYSKNTYYITINYVDENNNKLIDSDIYSFKYLTRFSIEAKEIDGYTPIVDEVEGIADSNKELNIQYRINQYLLTINYLDECGRPILESYQELLDYNSYYEIESLDIRGYKCSNKIVSGIIEEDTIINVIYSKVKSELIIYYVDARFNNIICPTVLELDYYTYYTFVTPCIKGYYTNKFNVVGYTHYDYNEIVIIYYKLPAYNSCQQLSFTIYTTPIGFSYAYYYYIPFKRFMF